MATINAVAVVMLLFGLSSAHSVNVQALDFASVCLVMSILFFALEIYLLPSIIAVKRGVTASGGLIAINVFLAWTVLVWIVLLFWASCGGTQDQDRLIKLQLEKLSDGRN